MTDLTEELIAHIKATAGAEALDQAADALTPDDIGQKAQRWLRARAEELRSTSPMNGKPENAVIFPNIQPEEFIFAGEADATRRRGSGEITAMHVRAGDDISGIDMFDMNRVFSITEVQQGSSTVTLLFNYGGVDLYPSNKVFLVRTKDAE